jgi:hypothetical protein
MNTRVFALMQFKLSYVAKVKVRTSGLKAAAQPHFKP